MIETKTIPTIDDGTVIDHVETSMAEQIFFMLNQHAKGSVVSLATGIDSDSMGKKAIIKVHERTLTSEETDQLALLSPKATVNIIKGGEVVSKSPVKAPKEVRSLFSCNNPRCITNHEEVETRFLVKPGGRIRCHYCEKIQCINCPH